MKNIIYTIVLVLIGGVALAQTTVRFEPKTVNLGESAQLIFESDEPIKKAPDLEGLTGKFALAGQQQSSRTIQINGRVSVQYSLIWNVFPRRSGKLSTGELTLNEKKLKPAVLTVLNATEGEKPPIELSAKVSVSEAYPEQLIFLTVQLLSGTTLLDAKIMPPTIKNARIVQLDMDKSYQALVENEPRLVIERTYAVIPEKDGKMTIPPVEVYGAIPGGPTVSQADLFTQGMLFNGLMNGQKDIRLESKPIQITVLPKPTDWTGWWLPAESVELTVQDSFPEKINAGDSLTRKITLTATGLTAPQLPALTQPTGSAVKVYPSPDQRETNQTQDGSIQGTETVSVILVPTSGGDIKIPAVNVAWFNTRTKQVEQATIPEKVITVQGGTQQLTAPAPQTVSSATPKTTGERKNRKRQNSASTTPDGSVTPDTLGFWIYWTIGLTSIALIGGLILGFILFRKRHPKTYFLEEREAAKRHKKKKKAVPDLYPF